MQDSKITKLVIYQAPNGAIELPVDAVGETIWATQKQIAEVFMLDQSGVARHIKNILQNEEVDKKSNMQKMHNAISDKPVTLYSLDIILAVGYRANSGNAINFRKWATKTLRNYITDGFVINPTRIEYNRSQFTKALQDMQLLAAKTDQVGSTETVDLTLAFAKTWFSLDAFDKENLPSGGTIKQHIEIGAQELQTEIAKLKQRLVKSHEATDIFATERIKADLIRFFTTSSSRLGAKTYTQH